MCAQTDMCVIFSVKFAQIIYASLKNAFVLICRTIFFSLTREMQIFEKIFN